MSAKLEAARPNTGVRRPVTYLGRTLLLSLGLSFVYGLFAPLAEYKAGEAFLVVAGFVIMGSVTAYWLRRDNEHFAVQWSNGRLVLMVLTPTSPFAFLWYFIKSRGFVRGALAFIGLIGFSLFCLGAVFGGAYASLTLAS